MYGRLQRINNGDGTITLTGPCVVTGEEYTVTVKAESLEAYDRGAYAQNAFPYLSKDDREFLISGTSPFAWRLTFGEEAAESDGVDPTDLASYFDWLVRGKQDMEGEGPRN